MKLTKHAVFEGKYLCIVLFAGLYCLTAFRRLYLECNVLLGSFNCRKLYIEYVFLFAGFYVMK